MTWDIEEAPRHYYGKHRIWVHSTKYLVREGPETLRKPGREK